MKAKELQTKSTEELQRLKVELAEEIFRLEFRRRSGQAAQCGQIKAARQKLARVNTVLRSQEGTV